MNDRKGRFLIKIIPPAGSAVYRIHFRRRHVAALATVLVLVIAGLVGVHFAQLHAASADVARLQAQRVHEQLRLDGIERQAQALQRQNSASERAIDLIKRALGAEKTNAARVHAAVAGREPAPTLAQRLERLTSAAADTRFQTGRLQHLAARVLNFRRMASIARRRIIAAIPSLNPVNGAINAAFGYRTNPFPEFHKGLDLAADYGTAVHAAAAGIVTSAGWEGGYGIKIDIDHGNGYHTWYCHLSRLSVGPGQHVGKGQPIAAAGSTGESTGPHLHYQVMLDGIAIDPMPFLRGVPANVLASLRGDSGVL